MNLRSHLTMLVSGAAFGGGLAVSGLTRPEVVVGFLDITRHWNPSLGIVMGVATVVNALLVRVALRRQRPRWASEFRLPAPGAIDRRLVAGAALFGIGWGLLGVCPGPALVSAAGGQGSVLTFVAAMGAGLMLVDLSNRLRRRAETHGRAS